MSTNSNFTFAIHIVTYLAGAESPESSAQIAASMNTNPVTVRKLIGELRAGGLVVTVAGSSGGALLSRDASRITLGDVYALFKDEPLFGLHPSPPSQDCVIGRNIQTVLLRHFSELDALLSQALMRITIADVIQEVFSYQTP
ncbi:MAG: Rrf2 family transcriptional regulator [Armatimonadetes bacterium]|nr:Rrf2 family transcriptional regulator [Anaerolineae bacterium]